MPGDVILQRRCNVVDVGGGDVQPLNIRFCRPEFQDDGEVSVSTSISCAFFEKTLTHILGDDLQAIVCAMDVALAYLHGKVRDGYSIYWEQPGDLDADDFWRYRLDKPGPPISSRFAAGSNLQAPHVVAPSHRVAVDEAGGLAVMIFRVGPGGEDSLMTLIPAPQVQQLGANELARTVGQIILMDTPPGRELFGCERDLPHRSKG